MLKMEVEELSNRILDERATSMSLSEKTLSHYGVPGMKWGVRKAYVPHPRKKSKLTKSDIRDARHAEMIGDVDTSSKSKGLTAEQKKRLKKLAIAAAASVGVGAAFYMTYKYDAINRIDEVIKSSDISDDPFKKMAEAGGKAASEITVDPDKVAAITEEKAKKAKEKLEKEAAEEAERKLQEALKEAMQKALDDTETVFAEGQIFHRVESIADRDFSKVTDPTYVSYRDDDRKTYLTRLMDWANTGTRTEVEFKAIKEIRAPSKRKAKEIFEKLWDEDLSYREQLIDSVAGGFVFAEQRKAGVSYDEETRKARFDTFRRVAKYKVKADPFGQAMYSIVRRGEDTEKFVSRLREAGYDAIEDYFDKGTFSKAPIILLDPSSSVVKTGEKSVRDVLEELKDSKF